MKVVFTICFFAAAIMASFQLWAGLTGLLLSDEEEDKEKPEVIAKRLALAWLYSLLSFVFIAMMCVAAIMK